MEIKQKPNRRPFFRFVKKIAKIFKRKPKFIYLGEKPNGATIYLSNHCAASGPITYELYLPTRFRMWGTYEMCGGFKMRWKYLNHVYFHQKKKYSKFVSFLLSTILTPIMALFYKGFRIIPTYPNSKFISTIKTSIEELNNNVNILIYPENSSDGYHDELTEYFGGFWTLAKKFNETSQKDISIVNMYFHKKSNTVIVANPKSFLKLSKEFSDSKAVAEFFLNDANKMYKHHLSQIKTKNKDTK